MRKTTKTCRELKEYHKPNRSKKMLEDQHEKKLMPKNYTTMWIKTSSQDSNLYFKFLFSRQLTSLLSSLWCRHITSQRWLWNDKSWNLLYLGHGELHRSVEALPIWSVLCWKFVGKNWKFHLPPYHCTGRTWKHAVLVFHERDAFCDVSESETNDHVSATFLLSHFRFFLVPVTFAVTFFLNPCARLHDQCCRNFAFAYNQGE